DADGAATVTDGPYAEAKEVVGGYWLIQARSKDEAVEWAKRCPCQGCRIEVRRVQEMEEFSPQIQAAVESAGPDWTGERGGDPRGGGRGRGGAADRGGLADRAGPPRRRSRADDQRRPGPRRGPRPGRAARRARALAARRRSRQPRRLADGDRQEPGDRPDPPR